MDNILKKEDVYLKEPLTDMEEQIVLYCKNKYMMTNVIDDLNKLFSFYLRYEHNDIVHIYKKLILIHNR